MTRLGAATRRGRGRCRATTNTVRGTRTGTLLTSAPWRAIPRQGYYSYDLGSWHVIVLNTSDHCKSILCSLGSPQETWLRADLAAHPADCTLAIWHDPLFSSGRTHGSLGHVQPFWETLYRYGADLVVNGHEHNYERFAPQTPDGAADPDYGIREIVAGTGGESHYREGEVLTANSEAADDNTYGVLKLTLRESSYDWEFIPEPRGTFRDSGSGECHGAPPEPLTRLDSSALARCSVLVLEYVAPRTGVLLAGKEVLNALVSTSRLSARDHLASRGLISPWPRLRLRRR